MCLLEWSFRSVYLLAIWSVSCCCCYGRSYLVAVVKHFCLTSLGRTIAASFGPVGTVADMRTFSVIALWTQGVLLMQPRHILRKALEQLLCHVCPPLRVQA